ncbi:PilW family protein [Shewanella surugensis]|uniref:PilW family protein n=1 Tax=Shewanella surugensis TaxID=212020 RepID=A0ABT0L7C1_9GAMM|nr:PilW family protein [Shewanella surugensis]MCL1123051.1 PilW family protein [Shewanella surugensis]
MHGQKGLSLVELMIAMVIGLFVSAGVLTIFIMSANNVTTTSHFNQLQENGRIALDFIERDLQMQGFMAEFTGEDFLLGVNTQINAPALTDEQDCIGSGLNNESFPNLMPAHFRLLWGYEQGVSDESLNCLTGVTTNTDVLQLKRLIGPNVTVFDDNRYYVGMSNNEAIFFAGDQSTPILDNARFWEYQHHVYFIKEDNGMPVLMRRILANGGMKTSSSVEQLVEGVENIRVLYGFDNDGDRSADSFMPAENVTSLMWDQGAVALRIFLLIRTLYEDKNFTNTTSYRLGDKEIAASNDGFRRKVMMKTLALENALIAD